MKNVLVAAFFGLLLVGCSGDDDGGSGPTIGDCEQVSNLQDSNVGFGEVQIEWEQDGASSFIIEYGQPGFSLGSGTQVTATSTNIVLTGLNAATDFEYYVRSVCASNNVSEFLGPGTFTTLNCSKVTGVQISDISDTSAFVLFSETPFNDSYEIEYGLTGFTPGNGTSVTVFGSSTIENLTSSTTYDVYVRLMCGTEFSEYSDVVTFTTDSTCATPDNLFLLDVTSTVIILDWNPNGETAFEVEYGLVGFALGTGQILGTSDTFAEIENLMPGTTYEVYVRANCGSQGFSNYSEVLVVTTNP